MTVSQGLTSSGLVREGVVSSLMTGAVLLCSPSLTQAARAPWQVSICQEGGAS